MVVRKEKRNRKYHGTRRWGVGNIKNARGAGDRGGVGVGRRKHRFTYFTAKEPWMIGRKGFTKWKPEKLEAVTLDEVSRIAAKSGSNTVELRGVKVLSNGRLESGISVKASAFSKKAIDKIKEAHGEAVKID
ncbi:MAG: uL15 family ribosomal protein [Candidatus Marsarchaeota archaeon]|nr:uL15 family ribosomal protein [Candidatus Marsarchaeota archaeon]